MFREILVPLDGSKLSEASLTAAAVIADRFHSRITLLHIIERDPPSEVHRDRHLQTVPEAQAYLRAIAAGAFPSGMDVETHVHEAPASDVAASIADHVVAERGADLIVTSTHGRGGVRDMLFGRIAQRVVAQARQPVLLIKPGKPGFEVRKILVPLDPDSVHDASLTFAEALGKAFDATVELLCVTPTAETLAGAEAATSSLMPMASQAVLQLREERAREHVQRHVAELLASGLEAEASVTKGDPATKIVEAAEQADADMIILSTHSRAGLEAFWAKSVAPRVAQATERPLLMLPME